MTIIASAPKPAESGHWYTKEGDPRYTVEAKDGSQRPTTLRDARKMNLVPSVTTIIRCAASPGLEQWKQQQVLMSAVTSSRLITESDEEYINRILTDAKEQAKRAADEGSNIHASVQAFYEDFAYRPEHQLFVQGVVSALNERFGEQYWVPEKAFAHPMGFGGKVDLHCEGVVLDIKTKEFFDPNIVKGYDEHLMQLAAYRVGLGMPEAECVNVFVSRNEPGLVKIIEWSQEELERGFQMFSSLLNFWQVKNAYSSQ